MAGVIVEIDAVLSSQSLQKLGQDLDRATGQIGTGLAASALPAALSFSKQLIGTLQTRFKEESGVLGKQLADGTLSPAQYSAAANNLGKEIMRDLNRGIKSGQKLELFSGEGGLALRNQLQGITVAAKQTGAAVTTATAPIAVIGDAAARTSPGLNAIRGSFVSLASTAAGIPGPLGRITSMLLFLGGGGGIALAASVAIGLAALAIDRLTKSAREGKKAADDLIKSLKDLGKSEGQLLQEQVATQRAAIEATKDRIDDIEETRAKLRKQGGGVFLTEEGLQDELKRLRDLETGLAALRQKQVDLKHPFTVETSEPPDVTREAEERERQRQEADRKALQRAREIARQREEAEKRVIALQEKSRELTDRAQGLLAENTVTVVDDLELALAQMEREVSDFFDTIPTEWEQAFTQARARIANVKLLEPIDKELQRLTEQASRIGGSTTGQLDLMPSLDEMLARVTGFRDMQVEGGKEWQEWEDRIQVIVGLQGEMLTGIGDASKGVETLNTGWQVTGELIAGVAESLIDVAFRLGGIDAVTADVLSGFVQMGEAFSRLAMGDLSALPQALGALGGIFGGAGESPELKALREAILENERALRDNTKVLEVSGGATGFSSTSTALDAILTGKYKLLTGPADYQVSIEELDIALRKEGSSFRELEAAANDLGIDISILSDTTLVQLQERMGQVDVAAIKAAEAMETATEALRKQTQLQEQLSDLNDETSPEARAAAMKRAQQGLGPAGSGIPVLSGLFKQDLGTAGGRDQADKIIKDLFLNAENLTQEQRGNLSVEDFRSMLLDWEHLLDEIRENEQQRHNNAEQETLDQRAEREQRQRLTDLQSKAGGGRLPPEVVATIEAAARIAAEAAAAGIANPGGPLAEDARRRAEQALADAERQVLDWEQKQGDNVSPGYQVLRTMTVAGGDKIAGELLTANVLAAERGQLLTQIRDIMAGWDLAAMRTGGSPPAAVEEGRSLLVEVHLDQPITLDGEVIGRNQASYQYEHFQNEANLAGNATIRG